MSSQIDFKELKKELKEIEPLSRENLDIKTWQSDLQLWIELQGVTDPKKIYLACILTSKGETRRIIQDLEHEESEEEEDSETDTEDSNSDATGVTYPSLTRIVAALETFYGIKEDQNQLLRELRALRIGKNERVKDFNQRYRSLYQKLEKKRRKQVSVLDYIESLQNNREAWKRVSLKDEISLERAFWVAEKVDRLNIKKDMDSSNANSHLTTRTTGANSTPWFKKRPSSLEIKKTEKSNEMEDLVSKMKNLTIKTCYFCSEKGHFQNQCPKLKAIIEENKSKILSNNLNH